MICQIHCKYISSAEVVKLQKHATIDVNLANFFSWHLPLNVRNAISLSHFKYFASWNSAHKPLLAAKISA